MKSIFSFLLLSVAAVACISVTCFAQQQTTLFLAPCNSTTRDLLVDELRLDNVHSNCTFEVINVTARLVGLVSSVRYPPLSIVLNRVRCTQVHFHFYFASIPTMNITIVDSILTRRSSPFALYVNDFRCLRPAFITISNCDFIDEYVPDNGLNNGYVYPALWFETLERVDVQLSNNRFTSKMIAQVSVRYMNDSALLNITGNRFVMRQARAASDYTTSTYREFFMAVGVRHLNRIAAVIVAHNTFDIIVIDQSVYGLEIAQLVDVGVATVTENTFNVTLSRPQRDRRSNAGDIRAIKMSDGNNTLRIEIMRNRMWLVGSKIGTALAFYRHYSTLDGSRSRTVAEISDNSIVMESGPYPHWNMPLVLDLACDCGSSSGTTRERYIGSNFDSVVIRDNRISMSAIEQHPTLGEGTAACDPTIFIDSVISISAISFSGVGNVRSVILERNTVVATLVAKGGGNNYMMTFSGISPGAREPVFDVGEFVFRDNSVTVSGALTRLIGYGVPSSASGVGTVIIQRNTFVDRSAHILTSLEDDPQCAMIRRAFPDALFVRGSAFSIVRHAVVGRVVVDGNTFETYAEPSKLSSSGFISYHDFAPEDLSSNPHPTTTTAAASSNINSIFLQLTNNVYIVTQPPADIKSKYYSTGADAGDPLSAAVSFAIYGPTSSAAWRSGGIVQVLDNVITVSAGQVPILMAVVAPGSGVRFEAQRNRLTASIVDGAKTSLLSFKDMRFVIPGLQSREAEPVWAQPQVRVSLSAFSVLTYSSSSSSALPIIATPTPASQQQQPQQQQQNPVELIIEENTVAVSRSSSSSSSASPLGCALVNNSVDSVVYRSVSNNAVDFSQCTDSVLVAADFQNDNLGAPNRPNFTAAATGNTMRCNGDLSKGRCAFSSLTLKQQQSQSSSVQVANLDLSLRSNTITTSSKPVNTGQLAQFYFAQQQQQQPFSATSRLSLRADAATTEAASTCNTVVSSSDNRQYAGLSSKSQRQLAAIFPAGGFDLDPRCMIRTLTKSAPLTLSQSLSIQPPVPRPPPSSITTSTNNAAQAVAMSMFAAATAVVPGLSFGVARQQAVVRFAERAKTGDCAGLGDEQEQELQVQLADSPMQLRVGSVAPKIFGAVIGNVVLVALFVSVTFLIVFGYVRATTGRTRSSNKATSPPPPTVAEIFSKFHIALVLYLLVSFLHAPTLSFGLVLVAAPDPVPTGTRVAALLLALLLSFVAVGYSVWALFLRRPCIDVFKRNKSPQDEFDADPTKDAMSAANVLQRLRLYLLGRSGEWWAKREKQTQNQAATAAPAASSTAAKAKSDAETVIKFQAALPFFDAYNSRAQWFVLVEFATQIGLAFSSMLAQVVVSDDGKASCMAQGVTLVIVLIAYLAAALILRPFVKRLSFIALVVMSVPQIVAVGLALAESQDGKRDKNSESSGGVLGAVAAALAMEFIVSGMVVLGAAAPLLRLFHRLVSDFRRFERQDRGIGAARDWARSDGRRNRSSRTSSEHKQYNDRHHERRERSGHDDDREALRRNFNEEFHRRHHSSSGNSRDRERNHHRDERYNISYHSRHYSPPAHSSGSASSSRHRSYPVERHEHHHHGERQRQHYSSSHGNAHHRNSSRRFDDDYDDRDEIELRPMRRSATQGARNLSNRNNTPRRTLSSTSNFTTSRGSKQPIDFRNL